ncbi:hypothetical protein KR222_007077 [Zaprionus bogoriensis]|nr:hypothetical protein KR222_007077 [Zaprionus bogoriensis]
MKYGQYDVYHIAGGQLAAQREFPLMARLGNHNEDENVLTWFCGGTLISDRFVLTAAHCLYAESGAINVVRLGELDFDSVSDDAQPEDFEVKSLREHPQYKYPVLYHDIAMVELSRAVGLSVYKQPACLPNDDGDQYLQFIAIGWGHTTFAGENSSGLRKVLLRRYAGNCLVAEELEELPNGFNASTQLCIGSSEAKDTCNGDSGGPVLVQQLKNACMYRVMGITSSGIGCGTPNVPSVYTRVYFYLAWIRQELARVS